MIIELRVNNCYAFDEKIAFSMKADMRNKKFASNVHRENNFNVLKVAGIYGPNNSGKTCLIKCIRAMKNILLDKQNNLMANIFTHNNICELGVTFLSSGRKFSYDFKYDVKEESFVYELFRELKKDQYDNEKSEEWLIRDSVNNKYYSSDEKLKELMPLVARNNLIFHLVDSSSFSVLSEMRHILFDFADRIDIVDMNNIPLAHTIELMKSKDKKKKKIVDFIKNADLYMDNFEYVDMADIKTKSADEKPEEKALDLPESIIDQIRLVSTYKGVKVPSMLFDSTGTKKITALASFVIEALEKGRILVVDELDSSIHFKLTRAIVSMFNNELNTDAQLVFTVHDINLMDCKHLFRKEQIWFVHKDEKGVYVYSLADFTAENGVRDTSDIIEKYRKGAFAALPEPELINSLLGLKETVRESVFDE